MPKSFTISVSADRPARWHDLREERDAHRIPHVDATKTRDNVILVRAEDTRSAFNAVFADEVDAYNAEQRSKHRLGRVIEDYYQHVVDSNEKKSEDKRTPPVLEYVVAIGRADDRPSDADCKKILLAFWGGFRARNEHLPVLWAALHVDEPGAAPHLHIAVTPKATGYKRGMQAQCALNKSLNQMGFTGWNAKAQWQSREMSCLESALVAAGYERSDKGGGREHQSLGAFKARSDAEQARDDALAALVEAEAEAELARQDAMLSQQERRSAEQARTKAKSEADEMTMRARKTSAKAKAALESARQVKEDANAQAKSIIAKARSDAADEARRAGEKIQEQIVAQAREEAENERQSILEDVKRLRDEWVDREISSAREVLDGFNKYIKRRGNYMYDFERYRDNYLNGLSAGSRRLPSAHKGKGDEQALSMQK